MIEIRSAREMEEFKPAGRFVADVLQSCDEFVKIGTNLLEIDELVRHKIEKAGAKSCYVDYAPDFGRGAFAHYICTSVNDAVLHGKPFDYELQEGDLLCLDFAASLNGWVADSAFSLVVGAKDNPKILTASDEHLIETAKQACFLGIEQAKPGNRLGDISFAIGEYCWTEGYEMNTEFGGHGVGHSMHMSPHIPNDGKPGRGYKLRPGLVFAIEPYICETTDEVVVDEADGWTIRSADGSRSSHWEHTVCITPDGPEILTLWE